jgi:hypothetical protein
MWLLSMLKLDGWIAGRTAEDDGLFNKNPDQWLVSKLRLDG